MSKLILIDVQTSTGHVYQCPEMPESGEIVAMTYATRDTVDSATLSWQGYCEALKNAQEDARHAPR